MLGCIERATLRSLFNHWSGALVKPCRTTTAAYKDPHSYPSGVAFLDDQYIPVSQAKVSVLDWGFLHSDVTYDTVHVWNGNFFRLDLHLDRFWQGMSRLRMSIPHSRGEVEEILKNCVSLSGHRSAYVEMICTRGTSVTFSRDPRDANNRFIAFAVPFGSIADGAQLERGLRVSISKVMRIPPSSVDPTIKNYHWLDLVQGLFDAYDSGSETALLLDQNGAIAEGPGFNVFIVKDEELATPEFGVLPGITRQTVFDICEELELPCAARSVSPQELSLADEIFLTSTAGGIAPVTTVDGKSVGSGRPGPITQKIKDEYWRKHENPRYCTPVTYEIAERSVGA